ncbi:hypothetical protein [Olivibacter jilunii]|uniref:hypothetical protein n=1 Tax=Olivibacter jilunii TaxID=985016 RepID=UPI003F19176A
MRNTFSYLLLVFFAIVSTNAKARQTSTTNNLIKVDLQKKIAPMKPIWAWFGYDEPNYTYMKDGKKLLSELADLGNSIFGKF